MRQISDMEIKMIKDMIDALSGLHSEFCPLTNSLLNDFMSWFSVYTYGAQYFDHPTHLSILGQDDFLNTRLGNLLEAVSFNAVVTNFSDLSLQHSLDQKEEAGTRIIYFEKKLRHSEEYERLCGLIRPGYFNNGRADSKKPTKPIPVVLIGNEEFIDSKLINRTIPLYVVPSPKDMPAFSFNRVEKRIEEVRSLIGQFWQVSLREILECYQTFPTFDWLRNQDKNLWIPTLVPSKVCSASLQMPVLFEGMRSLAKNILSSKTMKESTLTREQKVLEATLAFIDKRKPMQADPNFYYGPDMCAFIRTMLDQPDLRKEKISEILNDHDVVKDTWRPRIEVTEEGKSIRGKKSTKEKSTKEKKDKMIIQPTCYAFDKEKLSEMLKNYRR